MILVLDSQVGLVDKGVTENIETMMEDSQYQGSVGFVEAKELGSSMTTPLMNEHDTCVEA